ncbi:MAG: IS3 family transposase [Pyrinomonadaceae bacterium MAG19_C2-C3]|nr:IS3 family transposase [Pyrinomonadaceae bacterium MAG19_C2-C3]
MCRVMRVSRSAYHGYASGKTYVLSQAKAAVASQVAAVFYQHRRRYGSRRIQAELLAQGTSVGRFQVRSLMRRQSLHAIAAKCFRPQTTDSQHSSQVSPNLLLDVGNVVHKPGEVIVGDITYLPMMSGKWSYLATWQDKFTRRIVGWAVAERMTDELVIKAFEKAIRGGSVRTSTIVHTDRGSQYVSKNFRTLLAANKCRQSMSRRANCWDNAQAESLFSRYKAELLEDGLFEDTAQAKSETFTYIEGYYNRVRRHSALDYKTPEEFEREWHINTKKKESSSERVMSGKT